MYYIPQLLTNKHIRHGISNVDDGNMSYTFGDSAGVKKNRINFLNNLKIPHEQSIFIEVQHGTKIIRGSQSLAGTGFNSKESAIKADAIVTTEKNLALVVLTADCIPAILFDHNKQIIALAHLSRHNSKLSFLQILVTHLKREFGINPQDLNIYFGPSIKKESYIIPEFSTGFDLVGSSVMQLILKGVKKENIFVDQIDTAINFEFFSHYRDLRNKTNEGRFATLSMLV